MKRIISIFIVSVMILASFGYVASAETVHTTAVCSVNISECKTGFNISGKLISAKAGFVAIEVCDENTYAEAFPLPSVVFRDQVTSNSDGSWSCNVNLTNASTGAYVVKIGTSDGDNYNTVCKYTGQDNGTVYTATPSAFALGADNTYTIKLADGIKNGKFLMHFKAKLADDGAPMLRLVALDSASSNLWTGYDSIVDIIRYSDGGWGTGTELDEFPVTNVKKSEIGREYSFDVWFDMDRKLILFYMDGEYWETIQLDKTSSEIWGYSFRTVNTEGNITAEISDFEIIPYLYGTSRDFGECIPAYIYDAPDAYYTTEKTGNIFYNPSEIGFNAQVINPKNEMCSYEYDIKICDEDGDIIYSEKRDITLEALEKKQFKLDFDLNNEEKQYGKMYLKTVFTDKASSEVTAQTETGFLSVRKPQSLNKKIGNNVHFGHYMGDPYTNMNLLKDAGFSSARDFIDYASYTGEIGFSRYDMWKGYAQEYGIERVVFLGGQDEEKHGGVFPTTDEARKDFTAYAVGVAEELNGDAAIIELWNEVDWQVSASDYAKMLIDTVPAIKEVNTNAKIAVMCTARVNETAREWIEAVIRNIKWHNLLNPLDPADYMDIVSIHPYMRNIAPEESGCECGQEDDSVGGLKERVAAIRELLDDNGLSEVELIATEMGYYSTPGGMDTGRWNEGLHHDGLTEKQQAEYSIRAAALLYKDLDHMQFYVINKSQTYNLPEDGIGMTGSYFGKEIPYEGKPVYAAVAAFNDLLGNAEIVQENRSDGNYDYVFETADGGRMHMMWTTDTNATFLYSAETDGIYVYDIYGNKKYVSCNNGIAEISLAGSPIYVEDADFVIVDENGMGFNDQSTKIKAKAYLAESSVAKFEDVILACATYGEGRLISVSVKHITKAGNAETDYINTAGADEIKVFLWENLRPIDDRYINIKR
ncbi:MAG: hypothetical protein J6D26_00125 [Clostridia bacterium]|nr:hypothetical protein [Clostridia bacterium]